MNFSRTLGNTIRDKVTDVDHFTKTLGYSEKDAWRILEGRIVVTPIELERIADFLGTTKKELISLTQQYALSDFSNPDSEDRILDLIDDYVELKESIE